MNTGRWNDLYCHYAVVDGHGAFLKEFVPEGGMPGSRLGLAMGRANAA